MHATRDTESGAANPPAGAFVLWVDRYALSADLFAGYLRSQGFDVQTTDDPETALEIFRCRPPQAVVLDIDLPPKKGLGLLRRLTREGAGRCPVVIFTALEGMAEFCRGLPVAAFVRKGVYGGELRETLERILGQAAAVAEAKALPARPRVLLAEDDPLMAENIRQTLERGGYDVDVLRSGPAVALRGPALYPDVVVIKEVLSGMNGSRVAAGLKRAGKLAGAPVVLYDQPPSVGTVHRFEMKPPPGVDAFVPGTEAALILAAVQRVLRRPGAGRKGEA